MTADWSRLPHDLLARVSTRIINAVKGVNRVVYDITQQAARRRSSGSDPGPFPDRPVPRDDRPMSEPAADRSPRVTVPQALRRLATHWATPGAGRVARLQPAGRARSPGSGPWRSCCCWS